MLRTVLAGLSVCLVTVEAQAGAWTQPEGDGLFIMTTARRAAPASALFSDVADQDSNSTRIFVEYGVFDDLTLGLTAFTDFSNTDQDLEAAIGGHVRYRVLADDNWVLSVQGGASFPIERWFGSRFGDDRPDSVPEYDIRMLYGRGWQLDWGNGFISTEFGLRLRGEGQSEELRFDATLGHEPLKGVLGLMSVFASAEMGDGQESSFKLSPSIAYTQFPWLGSNDKKPAGFAVPDTVQIGVTWDVMNPEDGLEIGVSIWRRF
ncbi:MAG: hypothetical protein AAFV19_18235 [Pseudomonadota bacterium]